jgi:hypothetical protein
MANSFPIPLEGQTNTKNSDAMSKKYRSSLLNIYNCVYRLFVVVLCGVNPCVLFVKRN